MLSRNGSSTDRCSSSLTIFGGTDRPETVDKILKLLKTLVGWINFFEVLEKDFIYGHNIKVQLKKLDVPDVPIEVVDFLVTFGTLFEQILTDFKRKHDAKMKMVVRPSGVNYSTSYSLFEYDCRILNGPSQFRDHFPKTLSF